MFHHKSDFQANNGLIFYFFWDPLFLETFLDGILQVCSLHVLPVLHAYVPDISQQKKVITKNEWWTTLFKY